MSMRDDIQLNFSYQPQTIITAFYVILSALVDAHYFLAGNKMVMVHTLPHDSMLSLTDGLSSFHLQFFRNWKLTKTGLLPSFGQEL